MNSNASGFPSRVTRPGMRPMSRPSVGTAVASAVLAVTGGCQTPPDAAYRYAAERDTPAAYREFLGRHPRGPYSDQARARLTVLIEPAEFENAKRANTFSSYRGYLATYPAGPNAAEARTLLDALLAQAAGQTAKDRAVIDACAEGVATIRQFKDAGWKRAGAVVPAGALVIVSEHAINRTTHRTSCAEFGEGGGYRQSIRSSSVPARPECSWCAMLFDDASADACYVLVDAQSNTAADVLLFDSETGMLRKKLRAPIAGNSSPARTKEGN